MSTSIDQQPDMAWTNVRWKGSEQPLGEFRRTIDAAHIEPLIGSVREFLNAGRDLDTVSSADCPLGPLEGFVDDLRHELLHGRGLALVDGFPVDSLTGPEIEGFFWAIGTHLGRPVSQSVMGERLGHVRDMTATDPNARAYRHNARLSPHSDPADLLAFLCLRPAATGGVSRFVSSLAIHDAIEEQRPDLLERLYNGFRYHRLGENRPGSPAITPHRVPIFSRAGEVLSCRYVRQYIETAAHEDPDIALTDIDIEALDFFEALADDPTFHHEFTLRGGEAVFANNFTVLHARSKFADTPTGDGQGRHLLRLWLAGEPGRPVVPDILHFDGEPGIPPIPGRTPSYESAIEVQ